MYIYILYIHLKNLLLDIFMLRHRKFIYILKDGAARLLQWFSENQMKGSTDKCYL